MFVNIHTHVETGEGLEIVNTTQLIFRSSYHTYGIHPWNATKEIDSDAFISAKRDEEHFLGVGEIGLDKLKGPAFEIQLACFKQQVELAETLEVPVIIHCVKAWNELRAVKRELKPTQPWIYHGFNKAALLDELLSEGLMLSVGDAIFTNEKLQLALVDVPLKHVFIETDSANCSIYDVYEKLSQLKNIPLPALEEQVEENFKRIFKRWKTGLNAQGC